MVEFCKRENNFLIARPNSQTVIPGCSQIWINNKKESSKQYYKILITHHSVVLRIYYNILDFFSSYFLKWTRTKVFLNGSPLPLEIIYKVFTGGIYRCPLKILTNKLMTIP